ncbi:MULTISPECIES: hypothetical protein [Haloarcula]|uniref:hypothetical protein n=1 Tax=Haloarcula TaxID=2237 RepID=UPI000F8EDD90|nr:MULTISPECIES: hypothetical protein [Haloarcula]NHX41496.1 hypothetical protein [Haloarcula sp. R1-2]
MATLMSSIDSSKGGVQKVVGLAILIGLFITQVGLPRIVGAGSNVRFLLMTQALVYAGLLGCLFLLIRPRVRLWVDRDFAMAYAGLLGLVVLGVVALAVGIVRGHPRLDVVGDFYKFVLPAATVLGIYVWASSRTPLQRVAAAGHHLYLLGLIPVLSLYLGGYLEPNERLVFVYAFPTILVISYWLFRSGNRVAKFGFPVMAITSVAVVYYSQSLLLLIEVATLLPLTVVYYRIRNVQRAVWLGSSTTLILGLLLMFVITQLSPGALESAGYLGSKLSALSGDYTLYERSIQLGGSRAAEPGGVIAAVSSDLFSMLFGVGMGSTFVVTSPFPDSIWVGTDHFVHAGFWEAILRTGLLGGVAYLLLASSYLHFGWRVRRLDRLGALVCAKATFVIVFLPVSGKLIGPKFLDFFLFAYAMVVIAERYAGSQSGQDAAK